MEDPDTPWVWMTQYIKRRELAVTKGEARLATLAFKIRSSVLILFVTLHFRAINLLYLLFVLNLIYTDYIPPGIYQYHCSIELVLTFNCVWTKTIIILNRIVWNRSVWSKRIAWSRNVFEKQTMYSCYKNAASNIEQALAAISHKAPTIRPPASHHENYPS